MENGQSEDFKIIILEKTKKPNKPVLISADRSFRNDTIRSK